MYDFNRDGKITKEDVSLLLAYSELSLLMIDQSLRAGNSPKEGKYSNRVNTYLSYVTRVNQQKEIADFASKLFQNNVELDRESYIRLNQEESSEMFCAVMAILHENIPCTETINILKDQYAKDSEEGKEANSPASAKSPAVIAAPKMIKSINHAMSPVKKPQKTLNTDG